MVQSQELHAPADIARESFTLPEADSGLADTEEAGALDLREPALHAPELKFERGHASSASARKRA